MILNMKVGLIYAILIVPMLSCNLKRNMFEVTSGSMEPNLHFGNVVQIDASVKEYDYGDLVVHYQRSMGIGFYEYDIFISRIVALPGDSIEVKDGRCVINGIETAVALVNRGQCGRDSLLCDEYEEIFPNGERVRFLHHSGFDGVNDFSRTVGLPHGCYFVMGDNRDNSLDSRHQGAVPKERILGKVMKVMKR